MYLQLKHYMKHLILIGIINQEKKVIKKLLIH